MVAPGSATKEKDVLEEKRVKPKPPVDARVIKAAAAATNEPKKGMIPKPAGRSVEDTLADIQRRTMGAIARAPELIARGRQPSVLVREGVPQLLRGEDPELRTNPASQKLAINIAGAIEAHAASEGRKPMRLTV